MAIFSRRVDLPIPVFPMTYMWRGRSLFFMPKGVRRLRESVWAKYVTLSSSPEFLIYCILYPELRNSARHPFERGFASRRRCNFRTFSAEKVRTLSKGCRGKEFRNSRLQN